MRAVIVSSLVQMLEQLSPATVAKIRVRREKASGEPEIALVSLLGDAQGSFVDIGANAGVYAYEALGHYGQVIAVEAHPDMAAMLRRTFDSRARVLELALSDQAGEATLWVPRRARADVTTRSSLEEGANPGFDLRRVDVAMARLDALDVGQPAVIKIDVEGHEFSVLNGAVETLRRHRPICIVEVEERHNAGGVARAFAFFAELGYESWYLHRGRLLPGSSFAVSRLQNLAQAKSVQGGRSLDYVNNFIFLHPERTNGLERIRAAFP